MGVIHESRGITRQGEAGFFGRARRNASRNSWVDVASPAWGSIRPIDGGVDSMKHVYTLGILAALSVAACSKSSDGPAAAASASAAPEPSYGSDRRTTPIGDVPAPIMPFLPKHGVYASGAGAKSTPWRAVLDFDAKTLTTATGTMIGGLAFDKTLKETTHPLSDLELADARHLAELAWREPMPVLTHPSGDYGEVLVSIDGNQAFYLDGFGPMQPVSAATLVHKLKNIAVP